MTIAKVLDRPFTPASLAKRWECSPGQIRTLIRQGKLPAFTVGKNRYRIRAEAVGAYEAGDAACSPPTTGDSSGTAADGTPCGPGQRALNAARSAPATVTRPPAPFVISAPR